MAALERDLLPNMKKLWGYAQFYEPEQHINYYWLAPFIAWDFRKLLSESGDWQGS